MDNTKSGRDYTLICNCACMVKYSRTCMVSTVVTFLQATVSQLSYTIQDIYIEKAVCVFARASLYAVLTAEWLPWLHGLLHVVVQANCIRQPVSLLFPPLFLIQEQGKGRGSNKEITSLDVLYKQLDRKISNATRVTTYFVVKTTNLFYSAFIEERAMKQGQLHASTVLESINLNYTSILSCLGAREGDKGFHVVGVSL